MSPLPRNPYCLPILHGCRDYPRRETIKGPGRVEEVGCRPIERVHGHRRGDDGTAQTQGQISRRNPLFIRSFVSLDDYTDPLLTLV